MCPVFIIAITAVRLLVKDYLWFMIGGSEKVLERLSKVLCYAS